MNLTIRRRLLLVLAVTLVTYVVAVGFILMSFHNALLNDAEELTMTSLKENASSAGAILKGDFEIARTVAATLEKTLTWDSAAREQVTNAVLSSAVTQDKRFLSAWLSVELSAIDPEWTKPYGRKRYTHYHSGEPVVDVVNLDGDVAGSLYHSLKTSHKEALTEPYLLSATSSTHDDRNDYLGTSVCVPLMKDGHFVGLAGMDITLEALNFITKSKPFDGAVTFLVSSEGTIVSHEQKELVGKKLAAIISTDTSQILENISAGVSRAVMMEEQDMLLAFTPLVVAKDGDAWSIGTLVPMEAVKSRINTLIWKTVLISVAGLLLLVLLIRFVSNRISGAIALANNKLKQIARGEIDDKQLITLKSSGEMSEMFSSVNTLIVKTSEKIRFAAEVGAGQFDTEFTLASDQDSLGIALQTMRNNLRKFKAEEAVRHWSASGLTAINEIIRKRSSGQELYFEVLKTFVLYLKASQGAFFVTTSNSFEDEIELVATYAYDRKKFVQKRFPAGDNLVGQCIHERELIYLKEVPPNYVKITSGLGEALPRVLMLVPLIADQQAVGVIEIASFNEYKAHEIDFIKKVGEIIATAVVQNQRREVLESSER